MDKNINTDYNELNQFLESQANGQNEKLNNDEDNKDEDEKASIKETVSRNVASDGKANIMTAFKGELDELLGVIVLRHCVS